MLYSVDVRRRMVEVFTNVVAVISNHTCVQAVAVFAYYVFSFVCAKFFSVLNISEFVHVKLIGIFVTFYLVNKRTLLLLYFLKMANYLYL